MLWIRKRQVGVVLILYWYVLQQHNHVLYPSPSNNAHPVCPAHRRGIAGRPWCQSACVANDIRRSFAFTHSREPPWPSRAKPRRSIKCTYQTMESWVYVQFGTGHCGTLNGDLSSDPKSEG
ncbi:hypothetical protein MUK42_35757 [Musa troglodytarum]|uniref:Secreted protein n=1 Tax=Musa troglodytarum TaxID=320322 RepID=A0A9E7KUC6_9LILI|nr:hypothetical protein MUK42_35757 [Musa troglodytarum]URE34369.1 hypothetical protein MUK42_35757 [Musa troglodytarum]URE34373.1 hypothetical protein MUK42_35757 [Musa troglodytarum]URE34375.1 hypothetical protein MUK42_35757 [Musa troglodytarum]